MDVSTPTPGAPPAATSIPPAVPPTEPAAARRPPGPEPAPDLRDRGSVVRDSVRARNWSASGAVKVVGRVEVEEAGLSGRVSLGAAVDAGSLRSSGSLFVFGPVHVRSRLEVRGENRLESSVEAAELEAAGATVVAGPLSVGGLVHVAGSLELSGPATAGRLVLEGTLRTTAEVVASEIDLFLHRPSEAAALRGRVVRVRRRRGLPIPGARRPSLTVARIEAEAAELEGVDCEYLRADRISLGPDCHIVRYDGTLVARHASARIGPESRSPPPPGLSR